MSQFETPQQRVRLVYMFVAGVMAVFVLRLFYIQILNHDYYSSQAQASQLKQFQIPAERGAIYAYDGDDIVPLVLNENTYRIVTDPSLVPSDRTAEIARLLSPIVQVDAAQLQQQLEQPDSRYEILANKQSKDVKREIDSLSLPGIFTNEVVPQRVYIQGTVAPQVLGFVNDAGQGNYGVEQALNERLSGQAGRVRALTDQNNVPLLATGDNVLVDPVDGEDVVLTLDVSMQKQIEALLKTGLERAESESGSIIVLDAQSGAVKAMATYPTYDPAQFLEVEDPALYVNTAVSTPLEPGSIMKPLVTAAALEEGAVTPTQTYDDPGSYLIDGSRVENVTRGPGERSVSDILQFSLNTGATWLLMQLGGGEINEEGREAWHSYLSDRYFFGKPTGIEQGTAAEAVGIVPDPNDGFGLNIKYANTSFGQGISVTSIQMIAAVTSVINGGTAYSPTLVSGVLDSEQQLQAESVDIRSDGVVSEQTSGHIRSFMENVVVTNNPSAAREGYRVGGKTGTAEIANPEGGYFEDRFNGTYVGYVGGDEPEYTVIVRVDEPGIEGFAGSQAAGPVFADVANALIDNFNVERISQ